MQVALEAAGLEQGVLAWSAADGVVHTLRQGVLPLAGADATQSLASLTKLWVADAVRMQVAAGLVQLDQPVSRQLHRGGAAAPGATVRQLLQHEAGYSNAQGDPLFAGTVPLCAAAASVVLAAPVPQAGKAVEYSNAGYCVLGEVLLRHEAELEPALRAVLRSPLGAAGGWRGSVRQAHDRLRRQLPLAQLPARQHLADGSHYGWGWRHWPGRSWAPWTHTGRLPGHLALAATDGKQRLLVAHFRGDPADYQAVAQDFARQAWACMAD